jgi:hypothetical protein
VILAVEPLDGRLGFLVASHLHKAESLATAAFAILDYLGTAHCAEGGKQLLQIGAADGIAQIPNI